MTLDERPVDRGLSVPAFGGNWALVEGRVPFLPNGRSAALGTPPPCEPGVPAPSPPLAHPLR
jgi:hypothetical protein